MFFVDETDMKDHSLEDGGGDVSWSFRGNGCKPVTDEMQTMGDLVSVLLNLEEG